MRWNLRMKAAERGIWKSTEMRRRLAEAGLEISAGKMSALWTGTPTTIRLDDLDVICAVLDCDPDRAADPRAGEGRRPASPYQRCRQRSTEDPNGRRRDVAPGPRCPRGSASRAQPRRCRPAAAQGHAAWSSWRRLRSAAMTSNDATVSTASAFRRCVAVVGSAGFAAGALVGLIGGLVGLGGAEFRLPLLLTVFGFAALAAVIVNKAMSLVVVVAAIPARLTAVPFPGRDRRVDCGGEPPCLALCAGAGWGGLMGDPDVVILYALSGARRTAGAESRSSSPPNGSAHSRPRTWPGPSKLVGGVVDGLRDRGRGRPARRGGVASCSSLPSCCSMPWTRSSPGRCRCSCRWPTMLVAFFRYSRDSGVAVLRIKTSGSCWRWLRARCPDRS